MSFFKNIGSGITENNIQDLVKDEFESTLPTIDQFVRNYKITKGQLPPIFDDDNWRGDIDLEIPECRTFVPSRWNAEGAYNFNDFLLNLKTAFDQCIEHYWLDFEILAMNDFAINIRIFWENGYCIYGFKSSLLTDYVQKHLL